MVLELSPKKIKASALTKQEKNFRKVCEAPTSKDGDLSRGAPDKYNKLLGETFTTVLLSLLLHVLQKISSSQ